MPSSRSRWVLGISAFYHDSAAALLCDGRVVAAAQQERFSRVKNDPRFPHEAVAWCLADQGLSPGDLEAVVFYEKPWLHLERLVETHLECAPAGLGRFREAMRAWTGGKITMRRTLRDALGYDGPVAFTRHHEAHQALAFFASPFERAAFLTVDGVGEWCCASWGRAAGTGLETLGEQAFPHSVGLLYTAATTYLGFAANRGEYKVMGLAPYGEPRFVDRIFDRLVERGEGGAIRLRPAALDFLVGERMDGEAWAEVFDGPRRVPESELEQRHMDVAASIQRATEQILLDMVRAVHAGTGERDLVLGGGVALNSVANGRIRQEGPFERVWVPPAPGDAGSAVGAALAWWHGALGEPRVAAEPDALSGALLGPRFTAADVERVASALGAVRADVDGALEDFVAERIDAGEVVGWCDGSTELGPRALGSRSILADPRDPSMRDTLNAKVKLRESFRPFAPAVLAERAADWFTLADAPYMQFVVPVREGAPALPATTHVDGSARLQTVDGRHPGLERVLRAFEARTGVPVLVNTSFNLRGEPIVCTPTDAFRTFMASEIDLLVFEGLAFRKADQPDLRVPRHVEAVTERPVDLRAMGLGLGLFFALVLAVEAVRGEPWSRLWSVLPLGLGAIALFAPAVLTPLARLGEAIQRLVTEVLIVALFVGIVAPWGRLGRALGRDPLGIREVGPPRWKAPDPQPRPASERYPRMF